jgi:hypothetical protein
VADGCEGSLEQWDVEAVDAAPGPQEAAAVLDRRARELVGAPGLLGELGRSAKHFAGLVATARAA